MKKIIVSIIGDLNGKPVSLGRLMILISFFIMCWYWVAPLVDPLLKDLQPPPSLAEIIQSFLIYEGFKKGRDVVGTHLANKNKVVEES